MRVLLRSSFPFFSHNSQISKMNLRLRPGMFSASNVHALLFVPVMKLRILRAKFIVNIPQSLHHYLAEEQVVLLDIPLSTLTCPNVLSTSLPYMDTSRPPQTIANPPILHYSSPYIIRVVRSEVRLLLHSPTTDIESYSYRCRIKIGKK
jgi:hypothetical protein